MSTVFGPQELERIRALFKPRSVAVLGASDDPGKIGGRPIRYLLENGFEGKILPVNPGRDTVQGLKAYPSVGAVSDPVDLAIIALPARLVVNAVQECADAGVRSLIVFSAGFAEIGEEGSAAQDEMTAIARNSGMRILGPNCLGAINLREGMIGTFSSGIEGGLANPGRIGFVSQSGALGSHCFAAFRERGLGFSYWVTTGNECDIEFADCLAFLAEDPDTNVIAAYIEGCRDGDKLRAALALAHKNRKPVVLLKVGESEVGAEAAASHTASLAGSDSVYSTVFEQYGVRRARSISELMEITYACTLGIFPADKRIGLATVSGGVGVMMADKAESLGLDIAPMPEAAQARMKQRWEPAAVRNPVDTTAQVTADRELLTEFIETMLDEGNYNALVLFLAHTGLLKGTSDRLRENLRPIRERYPDRLILISTLCTPEVRADYERDGFPVFDDPNVAVQVVGELMELGEYFNAARGEAYTSGSSIDVPMTMLNESEAKGLLAKAGVPVAREQVVSSPEEAAEVAAQIGFPVVLKIVSPDILHKSEAGGVLLDIASAEEARAGYQRILDNARQYAPEARIDGVLVAQQIQGGVETLIGVQHDPVFGPVVAFGLGGIFVEILEDVALRLAPFDLSTAHAMIREIKGYPLLTGARGRPPADIDTLAQTLVAVSQFAAHNRDRLESLDINPFLVLPKGQGAVAVDALIVPRQDTAEVGPAS